MYSSITSHIHSIKFRDLDGHPLGHLTWNQDWKTRFSDPGWTSLYCNSFYSFQRHDKFLGDIIKGLYQIHCCFISLFAKWGRVPDCQYNHQCKDLVTPAQPDSQILCAPAISHVQNNIPFLLHSQHLLLNNAFIISDGKKDISFKSWLPTVNFCRIKLVSSFSERRLATTLPHILWSVRHQLRSC